MSTTTNNQIAAVLEKIKKLRRLAASSHSEHEAQVALLRAQELLATHGLHVVEADDPLAEEEELPVHMRIEIDGRRMSRWQGGLAVVIAENFRCICYQSGMSIVFLGLPTDAEAAQQAYLGAAGAVQELTKKYLKQVGAARGRAKSVGNNYRWGFINGLKQAFAEQVNREGWGLVLAVPAIVKQDPIVRQLRSTSKTRIRPDGAARAAGEAAGRAYGSGRALQ